MPDTREVGWRPYLFEFAPNNLGLQMSYVREGGYGINVLSRAEGRISSATGNEVVEQ